MIIILNSSWSKKSAWNHQWFDHRVEYVTRMLLPGLCRPFLLIISSCLVLPGDFCWGLPSPCRQMVSISWCCWGCPSEFRVFLGLWRRGGRRRRRIMISCDRRLTERSGRSIGAGWAPAPSWTPSHTSRTGSRPSAAWGRWAVSWPFLARLFH